MNAALLMMSSAWMAGADVAPVAPPAPTVIAAGCTSCGAPAPVCDTCGKVSVLDKLRAKFSSFGGKHKCADACDTCAPAPVPVPAPVPCAVPAPCDTCSDPCAGSKPGFLDRLKARFGKHKCAEPCDTCASAPAGCALPAAPGTTVPAAPAEAPKEMPKPVAPKTTSISLPIPSAPVTPVSGPKLTGTTNPF